MNNSVTIVCSLLGVGLITVSIAVIMLITWVMQIAKDLNELKKIVNNK